MKRDDKAEEIFRDEEFSFGMETGPLSETEPTLSESVSDAVFSDAGKPSAPKPPKDEFLGGAIVFFIGLSLVLGTGFFAYLGYRVLRTTQDDRASIETLGTGESEVVEEPTVVEEVAPAPVPVEEKKEFDKAAIDVAVLNGGAPGGTAGEVTKMLTDAGFAKAEAGNADKARTETEIFFKEGFETAAAAVGKALSGAYGNVKVSASDPKDADTVVAPVTVIVAK